MTPETQNPKPETSIHTESHLRSILKGFTWRFVATGTTILITYLVTGQVETAFTVGAIEFLGKILIYYLHERAWQLVPRGTIRKFFRRKSD